VAKKNNLLSIGDISKLTRASVQSIRYYEQIHLLEPVHVDADTGYRYYSFNQKCLIEVIQICIELGIPLKELKTYMSEEETVNLYDILEHGKDIAEKKLASIQKGLSFIDELRNNIDETMKFQSSKFYPRETETKYLCVIPYKKSVKGIEPFEIIKTVLKMHYSFDDYAELFHHGLLDIGVLSEYAGGGVRHYMFTELPERMAKGTDAEIKIIPAGAYLCTQSEDKQIEQASRVFADYLEGRESFSVIETEVFTGKYKINTPVYELRLI